MSEIKKMTDEDLKRVTKEVEQPHTFESAILAKFRMRRRRGINEEATQEMISAMARNATAGALQASEQRILHQQKMELARAETETQEEALKQARLRDEQDELEYKATERVINRALMMRAAKHGLDLPTYLEVMKMNLTKPGDVEMEHIMAQVKAGLSSDEFRSHMAIDLLREELAGLYVRRKFIEDTGGDEEAKKRKLEDIDDQINAFKGDKKQRESELVQDREPGDKRGGGDEGAPPDARLHNEDDTE